MLVGMFQIKFVPSSLLYGFSFIWIAAQVVMQRPPGQPLNHFSCRHAFQEPPAKWLVSFKGKARKFAIYFKSIGTYVSLIIGTSYWLTILRINGKVSRKFLASWGLNKEEELAFKMLYYCPIFLRCGSLIAYLTLALPSKSAWIMLDKFRLFNIDYKTQLKIAMLTLCIYMPGGVSDFAEVKLFCKYIRGREEDYLIRFTHDLKSIFPNCPLLLELTLYLCVIYYYAMFNYPLMVLTYSSLCISLHLRQLRHQIEDYMNHATGVSTNFKSNKLLDSIGKFEGRILSWTQMMCSKHKTRVARVHSESTNQLSREMSSLSTSLSSIAKSPLIHETWSSETSDHQSSHLVGCSIELQDLKETTSDDGLVGTDEADDSDDLNGLKSLSINSPHQLEMHLTKMQLLVWELNLTDPKLTYALCLVGLLKYIEYSFVLTLVSHELVELLLVLALLAAHSIPQIGLYFSGSLMENESQYLSDKIEIFTQQDKYLFDSERLQQLNHMPNTTVVSRAPKQTMRCINRIIILLHQVRFDCDDLLRLTLTTLRQFSFYILAALFIVVQYGKCDDKLTACAGGHCGVNLQMRAQIHFLPLNSFIAILLHNNLTPLPEFCFFFAKTGSTNSKAEARSRLHSVLSDDSA